MLFLQYFMINLVLTKSSVPKCHAVSLTMPIFAGFCVHHTDLGGGGTVAIAPFPPTPEASSLHSSFSLNTPSLTAVG